MNGQENRLRQQYDEFQNQWDTLRDLINKLDKEYIIETRAEEKFRLKKRLDEIRAERNQIEEKLVELENQLEPFIKKQGTANRSPQGTVSKEEISLATGVTLVYTLTGHLQKVNDIGWSPDGQWLASASDDGTVGLWDIAAGQSYFLEGHRDCVAGVSWSPDSRLLVSGANDQTVRIWQIGQHQPQRERKFTGQWINAVAWSPNNRHIAVAPDDRMIYVLDAVTLTTRRMLLRHEKAILRLAWSPDGKRLASASLDETACLWEAESGQLLRTLAGHGKPVTSVAWSPVDGRTVATASEDGTIHLWDTQTGRA